MDFDERLRKRPRTEPVQRKNAEEDGRGELIDAVGGEEDLAHRRTEDPLPLHHVRHHHLEKEKEQVGFGIGDGGRRVNLTKIWSFNLENSHFRSLAASIDVEEA